MKTLTKKEIEALVYIATDCDDFSIDDCNSWFNAKDLADSLGWSLNQAGGVMTSLLEKGLISDSGGTQRNTHLNDFYGNPDEYLKYPQIANLVEE